MKKILSLFAVALFAGSMMAATTMTCADAAAAALSVSANNELYNNGEEIEVTGYVTVIQTAWSSQYKNITFWMADAADGGKVLEAFRAACAAEADAPAVGDLVKVTGNLTKYNTTPEFAAACTYEILQSAAPVEPEMDYYVVGSMTNWAANAAYKLAANAAVEGEYMGTFTFAANDEFKVVLSDDATIADENWFPTGMGNNYVIAEAGDYTVYFRPAGNADWANGYFTAVKQEIVNVTVAEAITAGMALDSMGVSEAVYAVEGYVLNAGAFSQLYHNQSWYMADDAAATASDFQAYNCYAIQGADTLKVLNGDKVRLVGKLKKYYNKSAAKYIIEIEKGDASFITMTDGDHTVVSSVETATIAQALTIGAALANNGVSEKQYTITGYVSAINVKPADAYSDQYKNQSFWVADEATSTASTNADGAFYVYRGKPETEAEIPVGTKVQFTCTIKKYVPSNGGDAVIENADQNIVIKVLGEVTPIEDADVVFTSADFNGQGTSGTGSEVTATKDGVTFTCDKAFGDQYGVRCYKNSNVSITSAEQQIGKIVFEFATVGSTYYNGDLDEEIVVNGLEWNNTMTNQARMNKIKIYFGEYEKPVVDTLTAAEALAIAQGLEVGATQKVVCKAYIANVKTPYSEQYGNITVWLTDDPTSTYGDIQAFRAKCSAEDGAAIAEHDLVLVEGNVTHTQNEAGDKDYYEFASGAQLKLLQKASGIENVTLTEKVQKVVIDGVIYIVRDNKLFDVRGTQVR